jgi:tol-pal system protein YbgF
MKTKTPIIIAVILILCGCALQQDIIVLEDRIAYLERRNQELQQELERDLDAIGQTRQDSEKNLRTQYAGVNADVENVKEELRLLNGRIEEIEYLINRKVAGYEDSGRAQKQRLDELALATAKLEQRVGQMEQYLSMEGKPRKKTGQETAQPPVKSDKQMYASARQAYDSGDFDKARKLFQELIQKYPKSETVDNAQFWIGESYYREKWYERAILEYQTVIEKYPKGNKVPAAMLKQGLALLNIGEKSSARLILQELVKKFPKSSEADIAEKKLGEI